MTSIPNDAFRPILGDKPPSLGRSMREVWSEVWPQIGPIAERAYAGEPTFIDDFPLVIDRHGFPEQAYFTFCYSPIRDENGIVQGIIDTVMETTDVVRAREQARLVNRELEHRIKNILSVVSVIANQTLQSNDADTQARESFIQRIGTLARAQSIASRSPSSEAAVGDIIEEALAPYRTGSGRFEIAGARVLVSSSQTLTLGLAINELATNALKYGALSNGTGKIRIVWEAGRPGTEDAFLLSWSESGGPPVTVSSRRGFGSRILERVLAQDFSGTVKLEPRPSGLHCQLATQMLHLNNDRLE